MPAACQVSTTSTSSPPTNTNHVPIHPPRPRLPLGVRVRRAGRLVLAPAHAGAAAHRTRVRCCALMCWAGPEPELSCACELAARPGGLPPSIAPPFRRVGAPPACNEGAGCTGVLARPCPRPPCADRVYPMTAQSLARLNRHPACPPPCSQPVPGRPHGRAVQRPCRSRVHVRPRDVVLRF